MSCDPSEHIYVPVRMNHFVFDWCNYAYRHNGCTSKVTIYHHVKNNGILRSVTEGAKSSCVFLKSFVLEYTVKTILIGQLKRINEYFYSNKRKKNIQKKTTTKNDTNKREKKLYE